MQIINTNEFNANQKKYFELAEKEPVYVTRENAPTLVINVVNDEDTPSPEELLAIQKIQRSNIMYETSYHKISSRAL